MRTFAALGLIASVILAGAAAAQGDQTYRVHYGDTLDVIAQDLDVSVACLASANDLTNANQLTFGQILTVPADCDPYDSMESIILSNVDDLSQMAVLDTGLGQGGGGGQGGGEAAMSAEATPEVEATQAATTTTAVETPVDQTYVVKAGDNLTRIAQQFGTTASCLQRTNNILNPDLVYTGQQLLISAGCQGGGGGDGLPGGARQCMGDRNAGRVVSGGSYTVQEGDTLDFIGCDLNLSTSCLVALNALPNKGGSLQIGQRLLIDASCTGWTGPRGPGDLYR